MCDCISREEIKNKTLTNGCQHLLHPQNFMSKLVQDMEYIKTMYSLDYFLIITNRSFKDHLFGL
jgi:hypothetical protein